MPFGEEIVAMAETHRTPGDKYGVGDGVRQKFTGYERDEETGLDFAEARYYYNNHGRFTAVDPLLASGKSANPQTFNRYVYVMNNPLAYTDPTGLQTATTISEGRWYSPNFADDGFIRPTFVEKGLTVPSGWTIMPGVYWNAQSNRYTYLPENESIVGRLNSPIGDSTTSASMPDQPGGIEFLPGNQLSADDKTLIVSAINDMINCASCRQAFVDAGLLDPYHMRFYIGDRNQLYANSATSLGLTPEGLKSGQAASNQNFTTIAGITISNSRYWLGDSPVPHTVDNNPRIFFTPNAFGERWPLHNLLGLSWDLRTNMVHEAIHGAGQRGGRDTTWYKFWHRFRHDLYYFDNHDPIINSCGANGSTHCR